MKSDWGAQADSPADRWFRLIVSMVCPEVANIVLDAAQRQDWEELEAQQTPEQLAGLA